MQAAVKNELSRLVSSRVKWDCPLAPYTSFGIGGPAEALLIVKNETELRLLMYFFLHNRIQWRVVGKGTNILVNDNGFPGVVLVLGKDFRKVEHWQDESSGRVYVRSGCGIALTKVAHWCVEKGFGGLEFASGIPGTVGGGVIMNAGAWGRAMGDVIYSVDIIAASGKKTFVGADLDFGYRCWLNHQRSMEPLVAVEIVLELSQADVVEMQKKCSSYREKRRQVQPQKVANAGSIFKNPPHDSAGRLIEASGLKGVQMGGAMVSPVHANFIVNNDNATAADVMELMALIQHRVKKDSNVHLEPEVHCL